MVGIFADELALQVEELHVVDTVGDEGEGGDAIEDEGGA